MIPNPPIRRKQLRDMLRRLRPPVDRVLARFVTLILLFGILFAAVVLATTAPETISRPFLATAVSMGIAAIVLQFIYRATGPRPINWLTVDLTTMLVIFVFHLLYWVYWLNGWIVPNDATWISRGIGNASHRVCFSAMLSVCGLTSFAIGFNLLRDLFPRPLPLRGPEQVFLVRWQQLSAVLVICGTVVLGLLVVSFGEDVIYQPYRGSHTGFLFGNYVLRLSTLLVTSGAAALAVASISRKRKLFIGVLPTIVIIVVVLGFVIQGGRFVPFLLLSVFAATYTERVRRLTLPMALVGGCVLAVLLGVIAVARQSPERTPWSMYETVRYRWSEMRWDRELLSSSYQVRVLHAGTAYVPDQRDYFRGALMWHEVLGLIPFSRTLLPREITQLADGIQFATSSYLMTWLIHQDFSSGAGSSCIIDLYLNFGLAGVVVGMMLLGCLAKYIQQKARSNTSVPWGAAYGLTVPVMAYLARSSILGPLIGDIIMPVAVLVVVGTLTGIMGVANSSRGTTPGHWLAAGHNKVG